MITTLSLKNDLTEIQRLAVAVDVFGTNHRLPASLIHDVTLVLEEVFSNIVFYAYKDQGLHLITVRMQIAGGQLILQITDSGRSFNPLTVPPPYLKQSMEDRKIGGLGIYFVHKLMDNLEYQRVKGKNVLTLTRNLVGEIGVKT